ncbi:MAG: hypothetical protein JXA54_04950 [Candidatus Heimdallarchaeota archaeon]|nr:hypothetical protein [Candidatus Heimdallarchaeota archaeon]
MTEYLPKKRKGHNFNFIIGLIFIWFFPFGLILFVQSLRYKKKSDKELFEIYKKIEDRRAARSGKKIKYINIP